MRTLPDSLDHQVGLFFVVNGSVFLHTCDLENAEIYGDFINYPGSHDEIWLTHYQQEYQVDFDYFPRGRILYNRNKQQYVLYHDGCIESAAKELQARYPAAQCYLARDEHYQCHLCCDGYVV